MALIGATAMMVRARDRSNDLMSPTVFRSGGFRFYFFSREEPRMHVHVYSVAGGAEFWIEPLIQLAQNSGLSDRQLHVARQLVEDHQDVIRSAWTRHFES